MKLLDKGLTRRGILKRLGVAALLLPIARLGKVVADQEQRRRRMKEKLDLDDLWIGHC